MDLPTVRLETKLDMEKICRACLRSDKEMFLIYDKNYAIGQKTIATMLSEFTIYTVERFDHLPHLICSLCMHSLKTAYRFKHQCEQSYRHLIGLLDNSKSPCHTSMNGVKLELVDNLEKSTQTEDSTIYPCERCESKFFTFYALRAHREEVHKGSAIVCRFCGKTFNRIGYLRTHIAIFHPESGYKSHNECHICKRQFTRKEHMRRHMAITHTIAELVDDDEEEEEEVAQDHNDKLNVELHIKKSFVANNDCSKSNVTLTSDKVRVMEKIANDTDNDDADAGVNGDDHDDDDEKPLISLINRNTPINGFIEVLLNESTSEDKFNENVELAPESVEHETECDALLISDLAPLKRKRGRPRRNNAILQQQEFKCQKCDKLFQQQTMLQSHVSLCTNDVPKHKCLICAKHFPYNDDLKLHMQAVHRLECDKCGEEFAHVTKLRRHQETKHSRKRYTCEKCEKTFTTKIYLQRHLLIHGKSKYTCKECAQIYASKEELQAHIKAEGHDKPMLCPECGLRCKTSNILMVHMRRHNGEKPFKCKFCSKGFPRMDDLRVHEKYHTGEKSHFCETCGKGFQRKYNLTIHMRVHTGEKPYKCPHCSQAFAQGNDLKSHIRRHTGERFRCEVCGAAFLQGYQIRQHKLNEHGIKEEPPTQRVAKFTSPEEQAQQIKQNLQKELTKTTCSENVCMETTHTTTTVPVAVAIADLSSTTA